MERSLNLVPRLQALRDKKNNNADAEIDIMPRSTFDLIFTQLIPNGYS